MSGSTGRHETFIFAELLGPSCSFGIVETSSSLAIINCQASCYLSIVSGTGGSVEAMHAVSASGHEFAHCAIVWKIFPKVRS